ncbi:hypothetical protein [Nocardioides alkalitolerans]|uniref:hypothetical protein n=1 Tax=Nocardioides alkalitolerans TaxID=281714 RepID=UPI000693F0C6|nr:hypothetical protein [Nocardioides alkalitolerans]
MAIVELGKDSSGRRLRVDESTREKLAYAEYLLGKKLTIVQGSYMGTGGAAASAATHNGGGVIDIRSWSLLPLITPQRAVEALRRAGFVAWYRTKAQGFDPHIHAIDYGNPNLHPSAERQVVAWANGRNGLASNGYDDGPKVIIPKVAPPIPRKRATGPLVNAAFKRLYDLEQRKGATPKGMKNTHAGLWAQIAPLRAYFTVKQLDALRADKSADAEYAKRVGMKKTYEGLVFQIAYLDSLKLSKTKK